MKRIVYEPVSRYDVYNQPVQIAIPFAKGELYKESLQNPSIQDNDNTCLPSQFYVTSSYSDGSIRFLLCTFLANFKKNSASTFYFSDSSISNCVFDSVSIETLADKTLMISNNQLSVGLSSGKGKPFTRIEYSNLLLEADYIDGPLLYDENGAIFCFEIDENGWDVIDSGPVKTTVRGKGRHINNDGGRWFSGVLTITVYAMNSYIFLEHQIINTVEGSKSDGKTSMDITNDQAGLKYDTNFPVEVISGLEFILHLPKELCEKRLITSSFNPVIERAMNAEVLTKVIGADTIIDTPNEMFPEVLFSVFGCDWETPSFGVCSSIYQAYQNFPKAISATATDVVLSLFPRSYASLAIPQGVAKTSRFHLYFHQPGISDSSLIDHLLRLEMPPVGFVENQSYLESGVFAPYISAQFHYPTERFLYRFVDSRAKGLGFLHFGDGPEWEYVKQGRSKGRDIWINNEYDMPHNFYVLFARSGDRRYFDYFLASVRHWMDVDYCHYSEQPFHEGLLYTHSVDHVSGQPVPSHQWVEGFLDYFHATGDPSGLEIAMSIGSHLTEMIQLPMYMKPGFIEPRELGWTLRTFLALYNETHDQHYLGICKPIIDTYCRWADEYGTWTSPYPDNYMDRVPFMIHVGVVGLYQYNKLCPTTRVESTLLKVIDDVRKECFHSQTNMFMGKQHPSIRYQNLNGMVLETMVIGYELTKDNSYLEVALGMFSWITRENPPPIYDFSKVKRDDFTVIYTCPVGPKRCAQSLLPMLHYYSAIMKEGLLPFEY